MSVIRKTDRESPPDGSRWVVTKSYANPQMVECSDKPGWFRVDTEKSEAIFVVCDGTNWDIRKGEYKDLKRAKRRAAELNRADVQGPLDPAFAARRKRLKRLAPYSHFGDWRRAWPSEARWPVRPERYLIQGHDDGWHGEAWDQLADTLEAVRKVLEGDIGHEVLRVIDLDTGSEIKYERHVSVDLGESAT